MTNKELANELEQIRSELQRVRDEIRVRLHLGAMDARDAFLTIEHEVDHLGREITQTSRRTLTQALQQLKQLSAAFGAQYAQGKRA